MAVQVIPHDTMPLLTLYRLRLCGGDVPAVKVTKYHALAVLSGEVKIFPLRDINDVQVVRVLVPHFSCNSDDAIAIHMEASLCSGIRTNPSAAVCRVLKTRHVAPSEWSLRGIFDEYDKTRWWVYE